MRQLLDANLASLAGQVALSFSAGTDSTCLLFSLLSLGLRPHLYTYAVDGANSADLARARHAADVLGLELTVCPLSADVDDVWHAVTTMVADGIRGKVALQCMHGHYAVAPHVAEPVIVNGSGVDGLYGAYKTFAFNGARTSQAAFDHARRRHLADPNDDAMLYQAQCYGRHGVAVLYPYRQPNVIDYLMRWSWEDINRPRLKWITLRDYWQDYERLGPRYWRARGSQQIVAGTRALHDKLLATPYNRHGRHRVQELYKDIAP